ncbi:MAG: hypothetical protein ACOX1X_10900 [Dethiobacteria bacterium]
MHGGRLRAFKAVVDLFLRWKKYLAREKFFTRSGKRCVSMKLENTVEYFAGRILLW